MPPDPFPWWRIAVLIASVPALAGVCLALHTPALRIVLLCGLAMAGYGIVQDQVSARLCPEYFTIAHQPIVGVTEPTSLGLTWGFLGGWPGGLVMGIPLAMTATLGRKPVLTAAQLVLPLLVLLAAIALMTAIVGASSYYNAEVCNIRLGDPWSSSIPASRQREFFVVACAHFGTYASAGLGMTGLCIWVVRRRRQLRLGERPLPASRAP